MKKLISLLLALILVCSLVPLSTMAATTVEQFWVKGENGTWHKVVDGIVGPALVDPDMIALLDKGWDEYLESLEDDENFEHDIPWEHDLGWNFNTKYHWKECACGARFGEELHVDPLSTDDNYCICGYHFSDNADLVTLWINGCPGIKNFDKNTTEYKLNAYTYKDVKQIKISTRTNDSEATVELPDDLTLKEGENKFEIKVTSESQKVTKTYTVIITKEAQK